MEIFHAQPEVSGSFFPGMLVSVETPAGPIDLMNVHLRPPVSSTHRPSVLAVFQTGIVRRAELKYLVAELVCVCAQRIPFPVVYEAPLLESFTKLCLVFYVARRDIRVYVGCALASRACAPALSPLICCLLLRLCSATNTRRWSSAISTRGTTETQSGG